MAAKQSNKQHTKARAHAAARGGKGVRDRVRELSVDAFHDHNLSLSDVPRLVHDVLDGAVEGIDNSIPKSGRNVLREVFDGLNEGVHAVASAGSAAMGSARERGQKITGKNLSEATNRIRSANDEFLGAVKSYAGTTSKHIREELDDLVDRAKRTGPKVAGSARKAANSADGRLGELAGETARAGVRMARSAASTLAMGAGGFLEGLASSINPRNQGAPARASTRTTSGTSSRKARTTKKKSRTAKKVAKKVGNVKRSVKNKVAKKKGSARRKKA